MDGTSRRFTKLPFGLLVPVENRDGEALYISCRRLHHYGI